MRTPVGVFWNRSNLYKKVGDPQLRHIDRFDSFALRGGVAKILQANICSKHRRLPRFHKLRGGHRRSRRFVLSDCRGAL
jgi:hypothetical protein